MGWAWVDQHSMHLHSVTLSKMSRLGWWLPYIKNTSWIAYISFEWQLKISKFSFSTSTFELILSCSLCCDNGQIFKTIVSFNLVNFPIDHLYQLISPLSINSSAWSWGYIMYVYRYIAIFCKWTIVYWKHKNGLN